METELLLVISFIGILIAFLATILGYLLKNGLLQKVEVKTGKPPFKNITVAYKFARGPYKNAGSLFTEVHSLVPHLRTIGIYYDDPDQVKTPDLRYSVGAIVGDGEDISDMATFDLLKEHGFKFVSLPEVDNVVYAAFPFKGTISVIIGITKAYPLLREYVRERNLCAHPAIEVYDDDFIHFVLPLSKQDEFYIPEFRDDIGDTLEPMAPTLPSAETTMCSPEMGEMPTASVLRSEAQAEQVDETVSQNSEVPEALREISSANATNGDIDSDKSTTSSFEELQLDPES